MFKSNNQLFEFAKFLRDELLSKEHNTEASALTDVIDTTWTTSSEALGELRSILMQIRPVVIRSLSHEVSTTLDLAIRQISEAFGQVNEF